MSRTKLKDHLTGKDIDFGDLQTNMAYNRQYLSESFPPIIEDVTPNDDTVLSDILWIRCGTSGILKIRDSAGNDSTHYNVSAGEKFFGRITKVYETGTTCTYIEAWKGKSG